MKYLVVVAVVVCAMALLDLFWKFRAGRSFRAGVRNARKAERERKMEAKRLAKQKEIGDQISVAIHRILERMNLTSRFTICRGDGVKGEYCVYLYDNTSARSAGMKVGIDLRELWNRQIMIGVGTEHYFDKTRGIMALEVLVCQWISTRM